MVFSGEKRRSSEEEMERLNPLHNFDLPCLKWGNQKVLRCMKVDSRGGVSSSAAAAVDRKQPSEHGGGGGMSVNGARRRDVESERRLFRSSCYKFPASEKMKAKAGDGEIEATREKLMSDFQTEVGKMKDAILRGSLAYPPPAPAPETTTSPPETETPWNLRSRRAAYNNGSGSGSSRFDDLKPNVSPVRNECTRSVFGGGYGSVTVTATATTSGEKRDRSKFAISLSRRELEEDFTAMTGRRLPRKPKKRPRSIQKQLDTLFPGLWLTEITADLYRVPDDPETTAGKR